MNQAFSDLASAGRLATRALIVLTMAGTSTPTLSLHDAMWGNSGPVAPTVARTGVGTYTVTWPSSVTVDGGAATATYVRAINGVLSTNVQMGASVTITGPNSIRIVTADLSTFIATDFTGPKLTISWC